ncbi:IS110 family RNA-guided transposase [Rugamonas aquatica]|uniref:IS110 family transposase n=1 Tax=Rugamonas aquatica TaxID=2743357 RepID=A0A6A7N636_9BURK|nr:IS110 family transposase [Rugamonas aquatica]MQA40553.1 IS110 family transposase [Rugamonas aquatica]
MLFCGIDLHSNNCLVVVSDEADKVVYSKRLVNDLRTICSALEPYRQELSGVVVESTYNWYWLVDGLIEAGYMLHLANTTAIKQYDGLKHRGDESDARHLALLLRLGLLPEGHIMPKPMRAVRDLARKRMQLVEMRTTNILSIETCLAQQTGSYITGREIKQLTELDIDAMPIGTTEAQGMKANLAVMQALQAQIDEIEKSLVSYCRVAPGYRLLNSVSGIGTILAAVILLETGDIARFSGPGNYASYCRCVSSAHVSKGKKKGEGNTKNGNRFLAWAYVEAANFAIRFCEPARKFYQRKKAKRNSVVAIKAVAHKLARACFHMLKTGEQFSVEPCFS